MLLIKLIIKELINIESKDKEEEWTKAKFINEKLFNTLSSMSLTFYEQSSPKSLEYSKKIKTKEC